ncbi:MAG: FecR domain-containing protein [Phycisphaerae bacterium]
MIRATALATLALACLAPAVGAGEADAPLRARVQGVEGTVEMRPAKGEPWRPVEAGTVLPPGADLRTGFRARCVLDMVDSLVQIDPLSVVRIAALERKEDAVRTRLHLKQGNAQAIVEKGRIESDFRILTPSAALSVRGTRGIKCRYFQDEGGTYGLADRGLIAVIDRLTGHETPCRPGQSTDDRATPASEHLANKYVPITLDNAGQEKHEQKAAQRRHAGLAAAPAAKGRDALLNKRVQEINRADTSLRDLISSGGCQIEQP